MNMDPAMIGDWISFTAGMGLLFFASMALIAYWPGRRSGASGVLGLAIFIGFAAAAANTLYWQVLGHPLVYYGVITVSEHRAAGNWLDLFFKGGHALAGWLHLYALWLSLTKVERRRWSVLEMAIYPRRLECVRRLLRRSSDANPKSD